MGTSSFEEKGDIATAQVDKADEQGAQHKGYGGRQFVQAAEYTEPEPCGDEQEQEQVAQSGRMEQAGSLAEAEG
jgi:hypothetical protein